MTRNTTDISFGVERRGSRFRWKIHRVTPGHRASGRVHPAARTECWLPRDMFYAAAGAAGAGGTAGAIGALGTGAVAVGDGGGV
jgi:hypothetical protein